jgi:hypothetical protein
MRSGRLGTYPLMTGALTKVVDYVYIVMQILGIGEIFSAILLSREKKSVK